MNGSGLLRGLFIPLKHLLETYLDDIKWWSSRYYTPDGIARRSTSGTRGVFTVQYPEERISVPEEFRFLPFLVYNENADGTRIFRCTACGICAKVCPPQCIWIKRASDPATGKPVTSADEFFIDMDICMNCGLCAEYCPFDAIKMDHDYEVASYERMGHHIYNKEKLGKSSDYYAGIRPTDNTREEAARAEKNAKIQRPEA